MSSAKGFIYLLAFTLTVLSGCASKEHPAAILKVGMHIDAVLEFVIEYPLRWEKDRRLEYGRHEGEVRWRQPDQGGTLLQVSSHFREYATDEQELALVLKDYPGLTENLREQVELPAGKAWYISGQAAQQQIELYLFLKPSRTYAITLKTAPENFAGYDVLMEKIIRSFQILTQ